MADNMNRQVVVDDIGKFMEVSKPVYDITGKKIAEVRQFDMTAGYMQVHHGGLDPQTLYVPFHLIRSIDPREIYLTLTEDELVKDYSTLPASQAVLEQWKDWRTGQVQSTVGHEMRSGYSGRPVMAFQQNYQALGQQLKAGMTVYDINGANVGMITQFDSSQGWVNAEKGAWGISMIVIPFSAIARVEPNNTVSLLIPKEALQNDLAALLPVPPATDTAQPSANP